MKVRSLLRKMGGLFSSRKPSETCCEAESARTSHDSDCPQQSPASCSTRAVKRQFTVSPFIVQQLSSMYIDEDGDMADEFYVELPPSSQATAAKKTKSRLIKVLTNITPRGFVNYNIPRLHPDLPYIMCQVKK